MDVMSGRVGEVLSYTYSWRCVVGLSGADVSVYGNVTARLPGVVRCANPTLLE